MDSRVLGEHARRRVRSPIHSPIAEAAIEFKQLRSFVRIVDLGSFSRAAGTLHIAQSALSQHVASLEAELKTSLLTRTTRGVVPTEPGRTLYQHAQVMLQQAADARAAVEQSTVGPTGHVAFGLPLSLAATLGLPILQTLRDAYPGIKLQMLEELSGTILEWIKSGRLTLGIAFDDGHLDSLLTHPLLEERLFLVVPPASPMARRKVVPAKELAALEFVLPTPGQGVRERVDRALAEAGLGAARVQLEVDSLTILKQCAAGGVGPTILSWTSVESEVARGELCAVEIARPAITRVAHVCWLPATARSLAARCVLEQVMRAVRVAARRPDWRGARFLGTPA